MDNIRITDFIAKFSGEADEDVELWIDRLESAEAIFGEEKFVKLMPLFLCGNAYSMWKGMDVAKQACLEEIKSSLRDTFGMTKLQAWQQLKTLSLEPMASVDAYALKIERLLKTVSGGEKVPDAIISATILDGLPEKVREQLILSYGTKLIKEDILSAAKAILSQVSSHNIFMGYGQSTGANKNSSSHNFAKHDVKSSLKCICCNRFGHLQKDCWVKCFDCGMQGHYKNQCKEFSKNLSAGTPNTKH